MAGAKLGAGKILGAAGAAAAGHRGVGAVTVGAAVGDAVELQRTVGQGALERQARAVGRQEAVREVGLGGGVRAFEREVERLGRLHRVARDGHAHRANGRGLRHRVHHRRAEFRRQRVLEVFAHQRAAVVVDRAGAVGLAKLVVEGGGQHRLQRGVEGGGVEREVERLAGQRGFHRVGDADAVGRVAIVVEQLQRQQAVHHPGVLHVAAAGQVQRRHAGAAGGAAQRDAAQAERHRLAGAAGELARRIGRALAAVPAT